MSLERPATERSRAAWAAVLAFARDAGLPADDPVVLRDGSNLLVHLRPAPVVARVATTTATVRRGDAWLAREVLVAGRLAAAGLPVVAPWPGGDPGPHHRDGWDLSLWEHVRTGAVQDPAEAGRRLRVLHEALAGMGDLGLPRLAILHETVALAVDGPDRAAAVAALARVEALGLPEQPVHGDGHLGNVLWTADGPRWNDWEDTFLGPAGWDLACLTSHARSHPGAIAAALEGHGAIPDREAMGALVAARRAQIAVWTEVGRRRWGTG